MGNFQRVYSDDERLAVQQAWADRNIRPASRIVALAAEGELTLDGEPLPAFNLTIASARYIGERVLKQRQRDAQKLLAQGPPRDTVELLRRRLAATLDTKLADVERRLAHKPATVKPAELQALGRALRELAALPGPQGEPAQAKSPTKDVNRRGSLAGKIRASARPIEDSAPARDEPRINVPLEETRSAEDHGERPDGSERAPERQEDGRINVEETGDPGEYVRAHIPVLAASRVSVRGV